MLSFGPHSSVSPFYLTFCVYFYGLSGTGTSPKLERMVLYIIFLYEDCVCLVTFADWLELGLAWAFGRGDFHLVGVLLGQLKLN